MIITKPQNAAYDAGWDYAFGKNEDAPRCEVCDTVLDADGKCPNQWPFEKRADALRSM